MPPPKAEETAVAASDGGLRELLDFGKTGRPKANKSAEKYKPDRRGPPAPSHVFGERPTFRVTVAPLRGGRLWSGTIDGRSLPACRLPLFSAARWLLAEGAHSNALLVLRHVGSDIDAMRGKVGSLARLTVDEHNGTALAKWKLHSFSAVPPAVRCPKASATRAAAEIGGCA